MDMMKKPKATLGQLDQARAKMGMTGAMPDAATRNKMAMRSDMMSQKRNMAPKAPSGAPMPRPMPKMAASKPAAPRQAPAMAAPKPAGMMSKAMKIRK